MISFFSIVSKVFPYWIQGKPSRIKSLNLGTVANQIQGDDSFCLTIENSANKSNPMVIKSEDCMLKKKVMCKLEIPNAIENSLPPKFPCISTNQGATRKRKRSLQAAVESLMQHRQNKAMDVKCKSFTFCYAKSSS